MPVKRMENKETPRQRRLFLRAEELFYFLDKVFLPDILTSDKISLIINKLFPGVAQLVARMVRVHEAVGSTPATRTMQSVLIGSEYPVMDTLLFYVENGEKPELSMLTRSRRHSSLTLTRRPFFVWDLYD